MIARIWHGSAATRALAERYVDHFNHGVLPELRAIGGFNGAYLLQRDVNDGVEFTAITLWESIDAIRAFAGEDPSVAVVAPEAQAVLREYDPCVTHHEIIAST